MAATSRTKKQVYRNLRSALIERGLTLRSFALGHGYSVPTVYMAARGMRSGIQSVKIRRHLEEIIK